MDCQYRLLFKTVLFSGFFSAVTVFGRELYVETSFSQCEQQEEGYLFCDGLYCVCYCPVGSYVGCKCGRRGFHSFTLSGLEYRVNPQTNNVYLVPTAAWGIAFDSRLGCMENTIQDAEDIIDAKNEIFHQSTMLKSALPWYKYFPTPRKKKVFAAEDVIVRIIKKHTDIAIKKINDLEESGELRDDQFSFLRYLLSRPQLDYSDVLILSLSLPVDGISTTSRIFSFNLYSLAKNPDVQEKLFKEIDLYYHGDDSLTSENLQKMSYLKACVKESFRFFPVGVDISRVTKKDMVIGGYHIPAGTQVEMNNFVMSRLPEYFEEPERFKPERWIRDEAEHEVHPFIMLPFGHGPRMCIGRRIAEQEIYTMMAKLVKNFHLEWHYEDMGMSYNMLMDPSRPTQIRFVDRK